MLECNATSFPLPGPSQLQILSEKCRILNVNRKQKEDCNKLILSIGLVLSNDSKNVQNGIQMALK